MGAVQMRAMQFPFDPELQPKLKIAVIGSRRRTDDTRKLWELNEKAFKRSLRIKPLPAHLADRYALALLKAAKIVAAKHAQFTPAGMDFEDFCALVYDLAWPELQKYRLKNAKVTLKQYSYMLARNRLIDWMRKQKRELDRALAAGEIIEKPPKFYSLDSIPEPFAPEAEETDEDE
ncbi:MAG TPA: hypothetical protein VGP72_14645 [Planctomycetota bacterium]|jgi:hypothetical protein